MKVARLLTNPIAKFESVSKIVNRQCLVKRHSVRMQLVFMENSPDRAATNSRISFCTS